MPSCDKFDVKFLSILRNNFSQRTFCMLSRRVSAGPVLAGLRPLGLEHSALLVFTSTSKYPKASSSHTGSRQTQHERWEPESKPSVLLAVTLRGVNTTPRLHQPPETSAPPPPHQHKLITHPRPAQWDSYDWRGVLPQTSLDVVTVSPRTAQPSAAQRPPPQ